MHITHGSAAGKINKYCRAPSAVAISAGIRAFLSYRENCRFQRRRRLFRVALPRKRMKYDFQMELLSMLLRCGLGRARARCLRLGVERGTEVAFCANCRGGRASMSATSQANRFIDFHESAVP